jgi:hypothetical protein
MQIFMQINLHANYGLGLRMIVIIKTKLKKCYGTCTMVIHVQ